MTSKSTWKRHERTVAKRFGARRVVGSGSCGREDLSTSDSTHPKLYIECKLAKAHAVWTQYKEMAAKALEEGKVPVLALKEKGKQGFLLVVSESHLDEFISIVLEKGLT